MGWAGEKIPGGSQKAPPLLGPLVGSLNLRGSPKRVKYWREEEEMGKEQRKVMSPHPLGFLLRAPPPSCCYCCCCCCCCQVLGVRESQQETGPPETQRGGPLRPLLQERRDC